MKNRILVIDDNRHIFEDFRKILDPTSDDGQQIDQLEELVFGGRGKDQSLASAINLELEYASQGEEGIAAAGAAYEANKPFFMAFVDVRMPPGIDGVQTIKQLWHDFPDLPCVICTAHSDYEWHQLVEQLGRSPNLLVLRKPFDPIEVRQIVLALLEQVRLAHMSNRLLESMTNRAQSLHHDQSEQLHNLADELRTPLVSVLSYGERLLTAKIDEETRRREVNRICAHTRFLLDLVDKFGGAQSVLSNQREIANPSDLLRDVHQAAQGALLAADREFCTKVAPAVDRDLELPRGALRELLVRLVQVIVDQSPADSPLQAKVESLPIVVNSTLQFTILDDAPAISTETASWTRLQLLARQAGSNLTVLSGEQTSYLVSLTAAVWEPNQDNGVARPVKVKTTQQRVTCGDGPMDLRGKRILLAEDSPELQRMTSGILSSAGAQVTSAENGVVALDRVMESRQDEQEFDLALLDLQMPMMDGCTVARRMNALGSETPTYVLANKPSPAIQQRCERAGCLGVINKPVERASLLQLVVGQLC